VLREAVAGDDLADDDWLYGAGRIFVLDQPVNMLDDTGVAVKRWGVRMAYNAVVRASKLIGPDVTRGGTDSTLRTAMIAQGFVFVD
jgi:hypothetical protein